MFLHHHKLKIFDEDKNECESFQSSLPVELQCVLDYALVLDKKMNKKLVYEKSKELNTKKLKKAFSCSFDPNDWYDENEHIYKRVGRIRGKFAAFGTNLFVEM